MIKGDKYLYIDIKKQGPAIFLTLGGLDIKDINCDSCVQNINFLSKLYLKHKTQTAFETYGKSEKYRRSSEMAISDFDK